MYRTALNYDDMRALARRRLPRGLFEYIDRGSEDEVALQASRTAFEAVKLAPQILVDVSRRSLATDLFGTTQDLPLIVAPTALAGLVWFDGEVELARAAAQAGIPFCVSTQSITTIERIAAEAGGRLWFQLYILRDRDLSRDFVARAAAAGAEALVVTVDTVVAPKREYNLRNGFGIPITPTLRGGLDLATHPAWLWRVLMKQIRQGGIPTYAHYPPAFRTKVTRAAVSEAVTLADSVTWEEIAVLRRQWTKPLILKGILRADDARKAVSAGVDGIVVSNHGGRNLDSAPPAITVLPRIADTVGSRVAVLFDSGVRRGSDVVKARALGAHAVLVGRSVLWGTAAGGAAGAGRMLAILAEEIDRTMAMIGRASIAAIGRDSIQP